MRRRGRRVRRANCARDERTHISWFWPRACRWYAPAHRLPAADDLFPVGGLAAAPGCVGRRARQRGGVEVSDLVDALGELPAVGGALVAVVVDGVVQVRVAVAEAYEL